MAVYNAINLQQAQLCQLVNKIAEAISSIRGEVGVFTMINMIQFQIYALSIPTEKLNASYLSPIIRCLILMNNDKNEIKTAYSSLNIYNLHDSLSVDSFNKLIDGVKSTDSSFNYSEQRYSKLKEKYEVLLNVLENISAKNQNDITQVSNDYEKQINECKLNNQIISNELSNLQNQLLDAKSDAKNKEEQLNNIIKCTKSYNENIMLKNKELENKIIKLQDNNNLFIIIILILFAVIVFNVCYRMIINRRNINNKNNKKDNRR